MNDLYQVVVTFNHQKTFGLTTRVLITSSLAEALLVFNYKVNHLSWQDRAIVLKRTYGKNRLIKAARVLQHQHYNSTSKFHKSNLVRQTVFVS